jgi:hypothetical protein
VKTRKREDEGDKQMFGFYLSILPLLYNAESNFSTEPAIESAVEVEDVVTQYVSPNNGAGPLWCYGAPLLVRQGDTVFVSAMETGEDTPPLCNTRWRLFRRDAQGWRLCQREAEFCEREPCPLVGFADGRLFLSINPLAEPSPQNRGSCQPHLLQFNAASPETPPIPVQPQWSDGCRFTEHSYRGVAADGVNGELLLLNIDSPTGDQFWSYRDATGAWARQGRIHFPIRSCYPQVALKNRAAHVLAIGDIVEPVEEWRRYKYEQTKRDWDYVFRRLFYTWTPDMTQSDFCSPIELENVDAAAGYIRNLDLWIDADGAAHILYLKNPVQSALMRDRFFPNMPVTTSLEYCVLKGGAVVRRLTLDKGGEGESSEIPGNGRFHATDDGGLFVVYYCSGRTATGEPVSENRLLCIRPVEGEQLRPVSIALNEPLHTFFTATERGGSAPSKAIDLFGVGREPTVLRYARIRLK